jgi:hypothetical protein
MADPLDVARERVRQQRARDVAGVSKRPRLTESREQRLGTTFQPGDRVIDAVTGEEATVESAYRETVILPDTEG